MITITVDSHDGHREFKVNSEHLPNAARINELLDNCELIECEACSVWSHIDLAPICPACGATMLEGEAPCDSPQGQEDVPCGPESNSEGATDPGGSDKSHGSQSKQRREIILTQNEVDKIDDATVCAILGRLRETARIRARDCREEDSPDLARLWERLRHQLFSAVRSLQRIEALSRRELTVTTNDLRFHCRMVAQAAEEQGQLPRSATHWSECAGKADRCDPSAATEHLQGLYDRFCSDDPLC